VAFYLVANSRRGFCSWEFKAKGLRNRRSFKAPLPIEFAELPFLRPNVKVVSSSIPLLKKDQPTKVPAELQHLAVWKHSSNILLCIF